MFQLIFEKKALHDLNKFDKEIKERLWTKLKACKEDPFRFLEHLKEIKGFKLRVGDYRAVIDVDTKNRVLKIVKVGHRKNIYD